MARAHADQYIENFDGGGLGLFDSQVSSGSDQITFDHYSSLARRGYSPFSGDYTARLALTGSATSYLLEAGTVPDNIDAGETWHIWFAMCIPTNFTLDASDFAPVLQLLSSGTAEMVVGIDRSGSDYRITFGQAAATRTLVITRSNSKWHQIEVTYVPAAGTGTIDGFVDGNQVGAQVSGLTSVDITDMRYGISSVGQTINNSAGDLLLGPLWITPDARIYPQTRFGTSKYIITDSMAFVGPCVVDSIQYTDTGANDTCVVTDTDDSASAARGDHNPRAILRIGTAEEVVPGFNTPERFDRGVHLAFTSATLPEAIVTVRGGAPVLSHANYVQRGLKRKDNWAK